MYENVITGIDCSRRWDMDRERNWCTFTRESIEKIPEGQCGSYRIADINKKRLYTGNSMNPNVGIRG